MTARYLARTAMCARRMAQGCQDILLAFAGASDARDEGQEG